MGLTTEQKGQIALYKVLLRAQDKGILTSLPTSQARYDVILDCEGKIYRAQVKYADGKAQHSVGAISLHLQRRKKRYRHDEIDVLLAYLPQLDKICWFGQEVFHNRTSIYLRLTPTKSGQKKGCWMVDDYFW
jgi:PD-(D/E)XK endonuclease